MSKEFRKVYQIKMTKNFKAIQEQERHLLVQCPTTCQQVAATERKQFPIRDGHIIWWHCPACHGWHLIVKEEK